VGVMGGCRPGGPWQRPPCEGSIPPPVGSRPECLARMPRRASPTRGLRGRDVGEAAGRVGDDGWHGHAG